jgi:hypothetical protein
VTLTLTSRRTAEDVRVDAFVRAIRRSAHCTTACDHAAELALQPATTSAVERMSHRAVAALMLAVILVGMLLSSLLIPAPAHADTTASAVSVPCGDKGRGLRILCNLTETVAVTAHAITPR